MSQKIIIIKEQQGLARTMKDMLMLDRAIIDNVESVTNVMSKRNVSPQMTDKTFVPGMGISFTGIKQILVSLGINSHEVEDVLDKYDKTNVVKIKKDNGKDSAFIDVESIESVVMDILRLLGVMDITIRKTVLATIYQLVIEKVNYIEKRTKEISVDEQCKDIIRKYNVNNGIFYGNQQYLIRKEVSERLNRNIAFSQCLRHLGLTYKWGNNAPYFGEHGKEWLVCEIKI